MLLPPSLEYCGLTIILDKPSRFDNPQENKIIQGWAGTQFDSFLCPIIREQCEFRTMDDESSLRPGTKVVLLLGEESIRWAGLNKDNTLNEVRGNVLAELHHGITVIATYAPQDAMDRKDYSSDEEESNGSEGEEALKRHGITKRRNWKWWMMQDIAKAVRLLNQENVVLDTMDNYGYSRNIYPSILSVTQHLKDSFYKIKEALIISRDYSPHFYLDIETDRNLNITCIGFSFMADKQIYVVPIKNYDNKLAYDAALIRNFIRWLALIMSITTVVTHNGMFDLMVLALRYKIPFPKKTFDTMIAWHRCYPELEKSLGHLISYFLLRRYHKDDASYDPKNSADQILLMDYNANDVFTMRLIHERMLAELVKRKAYNSAIFACSMMRPYLTMMFQGMKLDKEAFIKEYVFLQRKKKIFDRCVGIVAKRPINPRSSKQVCKYLYEDLGLNCPNPDEPTNEKTLLKLLASYKTKTGKDTIPSVKLILASRECGKLASSMKFCFWSRDKYISHQDENDDSIYDRLTTAYILTGTDTFRLSSRALFKFKKSLTPKGWGTNVQNWDKMQRRFVIADKDKILIQVDQAGAEALIVAYLCRAGKFRELFEYNVKPHVFVALHLFSKVWSVKFGDELINQLLVLRPRDLKAHPGFKAVERLIKDSDNWPDKERYYFIAKMVCHAANYGMKGPTFQINVLQKSKGAIVLTLKEANWFLDMYHGLFPEIREWHRDTIAKSEYDRTLYNLFDEPRLFLEPKSETLNKQMFAFVPQSTVGEITNRAVVQMQNIIENGDINPEWWELDILQNNHDSLLSQCADQPDVIRASAETIHSALTPTLTYNGVTFKMKAEVQVGYNWGPYKKDYNEGGMKEYTL